MLKLSYISNVPKYRKWKSQNIVLYQNIVIAIFSCILKTLQNILTCACHHQWTKFIYINVCINWHLILLYFYWYTHPGQDHIIIEFINNYLCNQCLSPLTLWVRILLRRGVLDTGLCDKVCQWLATGRLFSLGNPVSSTQKKKLTAMI